MIDTEIVSYFLRHHFDTHISNVEQIGAGMFSQALAFNFGKQELVIRLNTHEEDFRKDSFAYHHFASRISIPRLIEYDRFDQDYYFAITERCAGQTLNALGETSVQKILPSLFETLHTLHSVDTSAYSGWGLTDANGYGRFTSWKDYLLSFYNQKFSFTWEELFDRTCMERSVFERYFLVMQDYLPFCAEDKYWVHGDFGFDNVLSDGEEITGVLDWAESRLGDFVYDLAYLEFWSKNIPYKHLWLEWAGDKRLSIHHFEERMCCYLIHIGLAGLAIAAIREDIEDYLRVKARLQTVVSTQA
jgi:hygromycin-B 4-O-kinase